MKLHIGGVEKHDEWKILNILPGEHVDYLGDISDLSRFPSDSVEAVYASHVLEHVRQRDLVATVSGLHRILVRGGKLYVAVPDMDMLCQLYLNPKATPEVKYHAMRMMFGGQVDEYDFHYVGLNQFFLGTLLQQAGFARCERVKSFGLFSDTSDYAPYGCPISLNVIATK